MVVYVVFARGRMGLDPDSFLAAYSTRENAQILIDAQDEPLRECLVICEVQIDRHPSDPYWTAPQSMAAAFHTLAEMPADALSDEALRSAVAEPGAAPPSQRFRADVDAILDQSPDPQEPRRR